MKVWHIGCSGFSYKHWKNSFYPKEIPAKKWFEYYCQHFNTVELNVTFYRFPKLSFLENFFNRSPESFMFSVKAPRAITHYKKFIGTEHMINDFYAITHEGLKHKLGCILFQMPPAFQFTEGRLNAIIEQLDKTFNNVLEFRHISWWNKKVYDKLGKNNITFCGMSHPNLPEDVIINNSVLYYRLHGVPDLYRSPYSSSTLKKLADDIKVSKKAKRAFIYFNNDIDTSAIGNAEELIRNVIA